MLLKKAGVVIITIFVCLIFLEFGLRALGRWPTNMADGTADQYGDSFRLRKNVTKTIKYPAFTYNVYTNEFGFRDKSTGPRNLYGKPFYAFMGASDVFGNGVEFENSFVGIFAAEANRRGIEVLNLAVGGHYFMDQEKLLEEFIEQTHLRPSTVFFCVNALHIPKFDQSNVNIVVKGGYPMARDGWRITYLRLLAGNMSSAFCFFRDGIRKFQENIKDFEANSKSPEFLEIYSLVNSIRDPIRIESFEEYLSRFEHYCRQLEIDVIYVYLPLSDSFRLSDILDKLGKDPDDYDAAFYERLMVSYCEKTKKKLINLRPILQGLHAEGRELRFKLDPHYNVLANQVIGEYLIKEIFLRGVRSIDKSIISLQ